MQGPFLVEKLRITNRAIASLRILLCICTLKCSTRWCLKELLSMGTKHCNPLPIRDSTSMSREKRARVHEGIP